MLLLQAESMQTSEAIFIAAAMLGASVLAALIVGMIIQIRWKKRASVLQREVESLQAFEQRYKSLKPQHDSLILAKEEVDQELAETQNTLAEEKASLASLRKQHKQLEDNFEQTRKNFDIEKRKLQADIKAQGERLATLTADLKGTKAELSKTADSLEKESVRANNLDASLKDMTKKVHDLGKDVTRLSAVEDQYYRQKKALSEFNRHLKRSLSENLELERALEDRTASVEKERALLEDERDQVLKERVLSGKKLKHSRRELEQMQDIATRSLESRDTHEKLKQLDDLTESLADAKAVNARLQKELEQYKKMKSAK